MALPTGVTFVTNIKGDKGNTGSLAFATAETIDWTESPNVTMVGPESARGAHFEIPLPMPGPELLQVRDDAVAARDQAEVFAAGTVELQDAAVSQLVADPDSETVGAIGGLLGLSGLRSKLDIWDRFDPAGGAGSWDASTYAGWIAGIDAMLASEVAAARVVKDDLGLASDETNHIYAYTGGASDAPHALIVSGTHGNEVLNQWACMRWFQQFTMGNHPAMAALRGVLRVTWIPTLTPSGYLSDRYNANHVNVNRNYAFFHTQSPEREGRPSANPVAFSEPESAAVKALLDSTQIAAVIDAHTIAGTTPDAMQFLPPSPLIHSARDLSYVAGAQWKQVYDTAGVPVKDMREYNYVLGPTLGSWAAGYLRYDSSKRRYNAAAVTIEAPEQWRGGTLMHPSREGIQHYCGYITLWLTEWLSSGQRPQPQRPYAWFAKRSQSSANDTVLLADGGTLSESGAGWFPVTFSDFDNKAEPSQDMRNYIDLAFPGPGAFEISFDGYFSTMSDAAASLTVGVSLQPLPNPPAVDQDSFVPVNLPAVNAASVPFSGSVRSFNGSLTVMDRIMRMQFLVNHSGGGPVRLRRLSVMVRFLPNERLWMDGFDITPTIFSSLA